LGIKDNSHKNIPTLIKSLIDIKIIQVKIAQNMDYYHGFIMILIKNIGLFLDQNLNVYSYGYNSVKLKLNKVWRTWHQ
jgi:hypothetical protein